jgi:flagellar hook-length control protein FliK
VTTVPEGAIVSDIEAAATIAPTGGTAVPAAPVPTADAAAPAPSAPIGDTAAPAPSAPAAAPAPALAEPSASQPAPAAATVPAIPNVSEQPAVAPLAVDTAVPEKPPHQSAKPARTESPARRVATAAPSTTQATPAAPNATKAPAPQPVQPVATDGEPPASAGAASPVATDEAAHKPKAAHAPVPGEPAGTPPAHAANERSVAFAALPSNATPTAPDAAPNGGLQAVSGVTAPQAAQAAAATPTNAQALPYAAPVPVAGLAVEIVARAKEGVNRFEIRLDPPELGRIDVHLRVDREGNVSSRLIVERTETLDLLRRDAPALERALQNAGLKTGEQGLEFSLRDQMAGRDHQGRQDSSPGNRIVIADDEAQPAAAALNQYGRLTGLGTGIDIRV